ncbi:hypothetical protein, partial [Bacillus cereus]|uniref:hypothetical protein n=1 Tax=Bacillus cereus TaxID=1396 RepID=UPI001C5500B1
PSSLEWASHETSLHSENDLGVWQPKAKYGAICKYIPIKLLIGSSNESTNIVDSFFIFLEK